jgi:probable rRNA maturation factor
MKRKPLTATVNYVYACGHWLQTHSTLRRFTRKVINEVFMHYDVKELLYSFTIMLADDKILQDLNKEFRARDYPTNVLSFPEEMMIGCRLYLGDIAISYERVTQEASQQNKNFKNHYAHMIVHGILHLLGYDHQTDEQAGIMEALEVQILSALRIPNPYEQDYLNTV